MKKICVCILAVILLCGCKAQETFETVNDAYVPSGIVPQQVVLTLPEDAAIPAMESEETGTLYLCDGYTVITQTLEAGDLNETLKNITGFGRGQLDVIAINQGEVVRYECVWTAAGEEGDQVGRAVILDDGHYHYVATIMGNADDAGEYRQTWNQILGSFSLTDTAP